MVQIELPHINILSKVDLIQQYGKLGKYLIYVSVHPMISLMFSFWLGLLY